MTINGYDVSSWDDNPNTPQHINFDILSQHSRFCLARAGFGGWVDRDFLRSWSEMRRINMVRGAYWYLTDQVAPLAAAQSFVTALGGDTGSFPPVVDFEPAFWSGGAPKIAVLKIFVEEVYRLTGRRCMIYTGFYVWKDYGSADPYWKQYPLWIATYSAAPMVPLPWITYKLWQYTDNAPGGPGIGVESLSMDDNIYNGTEAEFAAEFALTPPPPAPSLTLQSVTVAGVKVPALVTVTWSAGAGDIVATIDQTPVVIPPVVPPDDNLYRVAAEAWPELHKPLIVPGGGGPLVQVASETTKGGKYTSPLDAAWQAYIRSWNSAATWAKIKDPGYGPSQGMNDAGKLKWNYLIWPGANTVKVLEISGEWARIETLANRTGGQTPTTHPWLFHRVCDNKGNPVLVQGNFIVCPLIGVAVWVPLGALVKVTL